MTEIIVLAHNIRSTYNVGSIFRTCDGFGVTELILSGYTPHPSFSDDTRLPHIATKLTNDIHKTALGAELSQPWRYHEVPPITALRERGYQIIGLEQTLDSQPLNKISVRDKVVLLIGEEVNGISSALLSQCDIIVEIPMKGKKESFNVSVATGIALYGLTFYS